MTIPTPDSRWLPPAGIGAERAMLLRFSQGACLTLEAVLPRPLDLVIAALDELVEG